MRAAVLHEVGAPLSIESGLRGADLAPSQVRLRVDASGVCHSDLSVANGSTPMPLPMILGHEAVGTVIEVGRDVGKVRVGDRVITSFTPACGACWFCVRDMTNLCESIPTAERSVAVRAHTPSGDGLHAMAGLGAFADELIAEETMAVPVRSDRPAAQLALIGCGVATGVGAALNTARVAPGATVAVFGCGGVGQAIVQGARIAGAARIIAVDPVPLKRQTAHALGATESLDPSTGDVPARLVELTDGRGVDYAFEAAGVPQLILDSFNATRRGGAVVVVGMHPATATVTFPAAALFASERKILGCMYGSTQVRRDFPRLVSLADAGRLDLESLVSREIQLNEVNDAFRAMQAGEVIRSVIV
ncbi:Zn-dependent alcohol dehydrogenase [Dactylosporangium sp. CA-092794]|uniref:Zn-dependent alcohol dehydrogenase n=1 Tax=Dactylosporangium sp. CA-092794 TaxID=3239929 RepID=UPI003D8AC112